MFLVVFSLSIFGRLFKREKRKILTEGKVIFIGLAGAGKTTILHRLIHGEFISPERTMGLNADEFEYKGVNFNTFDLGGQIAFHSLWKAYVRFATAVVYVIDASNPTLFQESFTALQNVLNLLPPKCTLLLLANKSDLVKENIYDEVLEVFDLYTIQTRTDLKAINIFLLSTKTGEAFFTAFDWLASSMTGEGFEEPKINLHNVFVYDKISGIPRINACIGSIEDQPEILTPLFSAIDQFAKELDSKIAGIDHIVLQKEKGNNEKYSLIKIASQNQVCIMVVDQHDSVQTVTKMGEGILKWVINEKLPLCPPDVVVPIDKEDLLDFLRTAFIEQLSV